MEEKGKKIIKLLSLFLIVSIWGCERKVPEQDASPSDVIYKNDITSEAQNFVDSILEVMTFEEKIGQCLMPSIFSSVDSSNILKLKDFIGDSHVGGVVLLEGNKEAVSALSEIGRAAEVPLFLAIDAEWGLGMRLSDAETYPRNGNLLKDEEETMLFDYGNQIAQESREIGINMVLGPVIDITSNPYGVIGKRSYGGNPELVSKYGVAYAKGLESGGVISVAKHFPGHGNAMNDSHRSVAKLKGNITLLDSLDLRPFREYINAGLTGVMAGHIQSKALDPDGRPASVSIDMLTSLLREEMGFKGLILTDAFDMGGARGFTASDALKAGADIILCPGDVSKEMAGIRENVRNGNLDIGRIDESCRRILFFKYIFGIIPSKNL